MLPPLGWVSCAMCAGIGAWVCRRGERVWRSEWDLSAARNGLGSVLPSNLVYAAGVVGLIAILYTQLTQYAMSTMINKFVNSLQ